jgi:hypothetical protein
MNRVGIVIHDNHVGQCHAVRCSHRASPIARSPHVFLGGESPRQLAALTAAAWQ